MMEPTRDIIFKTIGDVKLNGENGLRVLFGLSVHVYFLTVNLDYNIGEYNSFGGGLKLVL